MSNFLLRTFLNESVNHWVFTASFFVLVLLAGTSLVTGNKRLLSMAIGPFGLAFIAALNLFVRGFLSGAFTISDADVDRVLAVAPSLLWNLVIGATVGSLLIFLWRKILE